MSPFFPRQPIGSFPRQGPLSSANQALPWIVFERDRATFEREFPEWRILAGATIDAAALPRFPAASDCEAWRRMGVPARGRIRAGAGAFNIEPRHVRPHCRRTHGRPTPASPASAMISAAGWEEIEVIASLGRHRDQHRFSLGAKASNARPRSGPRADSSRSGPGSFLRPCRLSYSSVDREPRGGSKMTVCEVATRHDIAAASIHPFSCRKPLSHRPLRLRTQVPPRSPSPGILARFDSTAHRQLHAHARTRSGRRCATILGRVGHRHEQTTLQTIEADMAREEGRSQTPISSTSRPASRVVSASSCGVRRKRWPSASGWNCLASSARGSTTSVKVGNLFLKYAPFGVVRRILPPGARSAASTRSMASGWATCSMTSRAMTRSNLPMVDGDSSKRLPGATRTRPRHPYASRASGSFSCLRSFTTTSHPRSASVHESRGSPTATSRTRCGRIRATTSKSSKVRIRPSRSTTAATPDRSSSRCAVRSAGRRALPALCGRRS